MAKAQRKHTDEEILNPHVNFETIGADGREILENSHVTVKP